VRGLGYWRRCGLAVVAKPRCRKWLTHDAVFHPCGRNVAERRIAFGFAVPLGEDGGRHFKSRRNCSAECHGEKPVEERRFRSESQNRLLRPGNELWRRGIRKAVYRKERRRQ